MTKKLTELYDGVGAGDESLKACAAKIKEGRALLSDKLPTAFDDTLWRIQAFLEQVSSSGEEAAKKADPQVWALFFNENQ